MCAIDWVRAVALWSWNQLKAEARGSVGWFPYSQLASSWSWHLTRNWTTTTTGPSQALAHITCQYQRHHPPPTIGVKLTDQTQDAPLELGGPVQIVSRPPDFARLNRPRNIVHPRRSWAHM